MDGGTPTVREVAAKAGCSIATVSRVATGNGPLSGPMQKRVVQAALQLGFPLSPSRDGRRAVLMPSLTNPVFAGVVASVEQAAQANGLSVILAQTHDDTGREAGIVAALMAECPAGLVMTVCNPATSEALAQVARQRLPAATVYNENVPAGLGAISVDNRAAMRRLPEEQIRLGTGRSCFSAGASPPPTGRPAATRAIATR